MRAQRTRSISFCQFLLVVGGRPRSFCSAVMPHCPIPLDSLRSTRSRIAKPVSAVVSAHDEGSRTGPSRDFSQYLGDCHPLRVIFIGHNPSDASWKEAAPYAHRSNRFWRLMHESGLVPEEHAKPDQFAKLPSLVGVGFTDLFVTSGSDASKVNGGEGDLLRKDVVDRILTGTEGVPPRIVCCVSKMVAKKLLAGWNGDYGRSGKGEEWGLDGLKETIVWVLPSTSGRAGLKWTERLGPFQTLAAFVNETPWTYQRKTDI